MDIYDCYSCGDKVVEMDAIEVTKKKTGGTVVICGHCLMGKSYYGDG